MSDTLLFLKLKIHKDKQTFIKVYDLYVDQIYRFIFYKVNDKAEAEDLTSLVFLKCWTLIQDGNLKEFDTLKALLYKISRNAVIDHYRKSNQITVSINETKTDDEGNEVGLEVVDETQTLEESVGAKIDASILMKELALLKEEYREIIMLRFVDDLEIKEISKILDKKPGNVRVLLHRAVEALKELLKNKYDQ